MTSSGLRLCRSAHKWTGPAACCGLILYLLASITPVATASDQPKRVLILYSFENEVGLYSDFDDLLRLTLRSSGASRVEFYTEFLDLARFPNSDHEKKLQDVLRVKYSKLPPESLVRFRQASVWQMYKWRFALLGLLIAAETMLIAFLLIQRRKLMQAESSLASSEERYRSLVEASHDWVWEADAEGVYTCAGPQCRELLGYEPKELIGKQLFDLMPPEEAKRVRVAFGELASRRAPLRALVKTNLHKDGRLVVLETNGVPIVNGQSRLRGYRGMDRDITRRKLREDQLGESERKYRRLYESMMDGFVWVDLEGRITEFNDAYCRLAGYEPEELLTLTDMELTPEKWHALEVDVIRQQVLIRGHSEVYEKEYRRKDGTIVPVESRSYLMRDESGSPCGKWSIVRDVGERKRAERALQEYEKAVESSQDMVAVVDREYRYLIANRSYLRHFGLERSQVIGRPVAEVTGEEFFKRVVQKRLDECLAGKTVRYARNYHSAKSGERTLFVSYFPVEGSTGIDRACCVIQDVTEREKAEESRRRAEREYREIFDDAMEGIYRVSFEGKILAANPALAQMLGFSSAEECMSALSRSGADGWLHPDDQGTFLKLLEERGVVRGHECRCKRKDGAEIWVSLSTRRVAGADGKALYYEGFVEDITRRKRAQLALDRQAAFDELITGVLSRFATCSSSEVDASVEEALRALAEFTGADHAYVIGVSPDRARWSATHEWCAPNVQAKTAAFQDRPMGSLPRIEARLLAGDSTRACSPDDYPSEWTEERQNQQAEGHLAALSVPIRTKAGIVGAIGLHSHSHTMAWSDDDAAHMRLVGDAIATALERKRSMIELQKSEEKFSKAFDASPVPMAILSLTTQRYIEANKAYEENTGFRADEIIGRTPDELGTYLIFENVASLNQVLASSECLRNLETQYRNRAGDLRTALLSTELIEFGGEPCILLVLEDITERKRTEQDLHELGARLLMVQEDERRRIARELHDDFSQRLALLAIDMEQLAQQPPLAQYEWSARLEAMRFQTEELTNDLHRLSYQLHPSKLEVLGLVEAVRSYCHTLSRQAGLELKFSDTNVPRFLPGEISLCIYRVVQEALHNVVRHSGVKSAVVHLSGDADEVRLVVSDSGAGFVVEAAGAKEGLGLVSMQERVRHVGGKLSIDTRPSGGTRISVRIPVPAWPLRRAAVV